MPQKPFPYPYVSNQRNPDKSSENLLQHYLRKKRKEKKKRKKKKYHFLQIYLPKDAAQRKRKVYSHPPATKTQTTNIIFYFPASENENQTNHPLTITTPPQPSRPSKQTSGTFAPNMFMTNLPFYLLKLRRKARRLFSSSKEPQSSTLVLVEVKRTEILS